jgi:hypothetical protein
MSDPWISAFWQALTLPRYTSLCGVKVSPLSVWHVYALENVGCAIVCGGVVEHGDVAQLLMVASRNRQQFLQMYSVQGGIGKALAEVRKAMLRAAYRNPSNHIQEAIRYADECMRIPHRWRKGNGMPPKVPHALHVLRGAVKCGVDYDRAWDMPYAEARVLFDVTAEAAGDTSIMDDIDQQMDEKMAAEKGA